MASLQNRLSENRSTLILLGVLASVYFALRSTPTQIEGEQLGSRLAQGRPTVLEFYSNY